MKQMVITTKKCLKKQIILIIRMIDMSGTLLPPSLLSARFSKLSTNNTTESEKSNVLYESQSGAILHYSTASSLTSEVVVLLRSLYSSSTWKELLEATASSVLSNIPSAVQNTDALSLEELAALEVIWMVFTSVVWSKSYLALDQHLKRLPFEEPGAYW